MSKRKVWISMLAVGSFGLALWFAILPSRTASAASEGSVSGVVTDDAGKPVRGAVVTAATGNPTATIKNMSISRWSDASGKYQIAGLTPGNYKVSATAYGYGSKSVDKEIGGSAADVPFSLKENWNPSLISTSDYISAFSNDKDMR